MSARVAGSLRRGLLIWTAITFLPAWLVTVRGIFDGADYAWGVSQRIKGRGLAWPYPLAPATAALGLTILATGWRDIRHPFHLLLTLWHLPLAVGASLAARRNREALRLRGDTLDIDISLATVAPLVLGSAAAGAVALAILERDTPAPPETHPDRRLLMIAAALLPGQFILLRAGEQDGLSDKLGVVLTILQWVLINVGLGRSTASG